VKPELKKLAYPIMILGAIASLWIVLRRPVKRLVLEGPRNSALYSSASQLLLSGGAASQPTAMPNFYQPTMDDVPEGWADLAGSPASPQNGLGYGSSVNWQSIFDPVPYGVAKQVNQEI
jgi:hypothetical protein